MITIQIDETRRAGKRIIKEVAKNPQIGNIQIPGIERDENGQPIGIS